MNGTQITDPEDLDKLDLPESVKDNLKSSFELSEIDEEEEDDDDDNDDGEAGKKNAKSDDDDGDDGNEKGKSDDDDESSSKLLTLAEKLGFTKEDLEEEFENLEDDSPETISKLFSKKEELVKEQALEEFLETAPDVKDLAMHLAKGLSVDSWRMEKQIEKISDDIDEDDVDFQEKIVRQDLENRGLTGKRLTAALDAIKDDGELFKEAKAVLQSQKAAYEKHVEKVKLQEAKEAKMAEELERKTLKEIDTVLKKQSIGGIKVPAKEVNEFKKFILSEEREKRYNTLSTEELMKLDYILWKNFDLGTLGKPAESRNARFANNKSGGGDDGKEMSLTELKDRLKKRR
jgi:hypothetical protein